MAVSLSVDFKRGVRKIIIFEFIFVIAAIAIFVFIFIRHNQKKDFDLTPRDKSGEEIEEDESNDPSLAPIYEEDSGYVDWSPWEDFLKDVGIIDIREGMIEYETGDNSRKFVMLAEKKQSNPYLKTNQELAVANMFNEIFYNGLQRPLKETTLSQKIEMTDFLNELKEHSQYLKGSNQQMKDYAAMVIKDTLDYQRETDRFETRTYLQFEAVVYPEEVYGDSVEKLEEQIHEKALTKLLRQITRASDVLKRADHPLEPLDTFGLLEVLYKTFHRESSVKIRFEDIIKKQRFAIYTTANQSDKIFKEVNQRIQIENKLLSHARDAMWLKQQIENQEKLAKGEDYYESYDTESDQDREKGRLDLSEFEDLD